MLPKKEPKKPHESLPPVRNPDINPLTDPDELIKQEEDADSLPDEDPYDITFYEDPSPGEGP